MLKWFTSETKSLYIARPESAANALIYLHPDKSLPRGAKLTVRADECVLFFREGQYVGTLGAGTHLLDTLNIPFLGHFLVDKLTDANHFITELYFISLNETTVHLQRPSIGQYTDLNSRNVVSMGGAMTYSMAVTDPKALVTQVAGTSPTSAESVLNITDGRVSNVLRSIVGRRVARQPVLELVSNADSEAIGEELMEALKSEFTQIGLQLRRIMDLQLTLDSASFELLRAYGREEAQLSLQQRGAQLATRPGFAEFNIVQGQRAALEGLGKGLGEGRAGFAMGTALGADLTRVRPSPGAGGAEGYAPTGAPRSGGLVGPILYYVMGDKVEEGPYKIRQVVNIALLHRKTLEQVEVRREDDPPGMYVRAINEPEIVAEFKRRSPG